MFSRSDNQQGGAAVVPVSVELLLEHAPIAERLHALLSMAAARLHGSCALTLRIGGQLRVAASSDAQSEAISQWQCTHLSGPTLRAIDDDMPVYFRVGPSARGPHYAMLAAGPGFSCALSIPVQLPAETAAAGALTVYSTRAVRFTPAQLQLVHQLVAEVAGAITLVLHIANCAAVLVTGVVEQSAIDTAVGILMARDGDNATQALTVLHAQAAAHRVGTAEIAGELIALICDE